MTIVYKYLGLSTDYECQNLKKGLEDGQLWFSSFFAQNDPMEGIFWHDHADGKFGNLVTEAKNKYVICSFGSTDDNSCLWSYYANGYRGVCIGFEPNGNFSGYRTSPICYVGMNQYREIVKGCSPDDVAKSLITRKLKTWRHEEEIRLLQKNKYPDYVKVGKRVSLCIGENMSMENLKCILDMIRYADLVDNSNGIFKIPVYKVSPTDGVQASKKMFKKINDLRDEFEAYDDWRSSFSQKWSREK